MLTSSLSRESYQLTVHLSPSCGPLCRPSWGLAGVVVIIAFGLLLLVAGETEFDLVGFLVVMGASMLAGFRWTITQVLLQGDRHHGARAP